MSNGRDAVGEIQPRNPHNPRPRRRGSVPGPLDDSLIAPTREPINEHREPITSAEAGGGTEGAIVTACPPLRPFTTGARSNAANAAPNRQNSQNSQNSSSSIGNGTVWAWDKETNPCRVTIPPSHHAMAGYRLSCGLGTPYWTVDDRAVGWGTVGVVGVVGVVRGWRKVGNGREGRGRQAEWMSG